MEDDNRSTDSSGNMPFPLWSSSSDDGDDDDEPEAETEELGVECQSNHRDVVNEKKIQVLKMPPPSPSPPPPKQHQPPVQSTVVAPYCVSTTTTTVRASADFCGTIASTSHMSLREQESALLAYYDRQIRADEAKENLQVAERRLLEKYDRELRALELAEAEEAATAAAAAQEKEIKGETTPQRQREEQQQQRENQKQDHEQQQRHEQQPEHQRDLLRKRKNSTGCDHRLIRKTMVLPLVTTTNARGFDRRGLEEFVENFQHKNSGANDRDGDDETDWEFTTAWDGFATHFRENEGQLIFEARGDEATVDLLVQAFHSWRNEQIRLYNFNFTSTHGTAVAVEVDATQPLGAELGQVCRCGYPMGIFIRVLDNSNEGGTTKSTATDAPPHLAVVVVQNLSVRWVVRPNIMLLWTR
jgi:hypothetical protein